MKKALCYLLSLILVLFYIGTLALTYFSKVPIEYKMYYIDHSLQNWPGYDGLSYHLDTKINFSGSDINKYTGRGWSRQEDWGTWTDESDSDIYINISNQITSDLTFQFCALSCMKPRSIKISANGKEVSEAVISVNDTVAKVNLPKDIFQNSNLLKLTFHIGEVKPLSDVSAIQDSRKLGIGLKWMVISQ